MTAVPAGDELERVPAHRGAALRVVQLVDDPDAGAPDVAQAVSLDPALTARLLQVANSAYFGLSGRVRTPAFAVTVVGFQTVRALSALAAAGVSKDDVLPTGFWTRSAGAAAGASLLAARVGAAAPDAFCAGMLHDLGSVLLWRRDPDLYELVTRRVEAGEPPLALEQEHFGGTHATVCAEVLGAWSVPSDLCAAIARHHDEPATTASPLRRALQGGIALGALLDGDRSPRHRKALEVIGVGSAELTALMSQVQEARGLLAAVLGA